MASVLVVDDEPTIREMIQMALEAAGHEVRVAVDGEEAVRKLRRRECDVIVLDLMMPRMDGFEVLTQIRSMPSREATPVIVVTARHDPSIVRREVGFGVIDHIAKPFLPSELEAAVLRALEEPNEARDERRRMLGVDAEVYSSLHDLVASARETV